MQVVDDPTGRFLNGVRFAAEPCGLGVVFDPTCGADVVNEQQTLTATGGPPTSGTFRLTFAGQQTAVIPYNATAAQVRAALEALGSIGVGNVTVTGGPLPGTPIVVQFVGALRGVDQPAMTVVDTFDAGDVTVTTNVAGEDGFTKPRSLNRGDAGEAWPIGVLFEDTCSTTGWRTAEYQARARRGLARIASWRVEHEFMSGETIDENGNLADDAGATTVGGGALTADRALEELVQGLADAACGAGVIHARPAIVERWVRMGAVRALTTGTNAGKLVTGTGHLVVAGTGYTGEGPAGEAVGATEWAYATDPVVVLRSDVIITPPDDPAGAPSAAAVDRARNRVTYYAEQGYAVLWNRCCHLAAEITR